MIDSPVLTAIRCGYILIVDEADKAPREVVAALRALAADRALSLSDGRRIALCSEQGADANVVPMMPSFRIFFLANKRGFPFLGNDIVAELGDVCAVHAVDNPPVDSEIAMLQSCV